MLVFAWLAVVATATEYSIDPGKAVVRFDGFGALSGGGATSKLLSSYPKKHRDDILDLLFSPKALAALQILKVEIGGDTCSTEGSELSHMHTADDLNCNRGYEWTLMKEAVARNPKIQLYGLPWGFPHWLGGPTGSNAFDVPNITADYITKWVGCAAGHGLNISWLGPWNEKDDQFASGGVEYLKILRQTLDKAGFKSTKLVAGDVHSWDPAAKMLTDPELMNIVDVVARHYPDSQSDPDARATGKPLWSSEDYAASNFGSGGRCLARLLNQNWVNGAMSGTIAWNLISSYYEWLAWADDGLMTARSPWSGHYVVQPPMYAAAHTTQFATPGWLLAAVGNGSGTLAMGGSYVSYFNGNDVSVVIEKVSPQISDCGFQTTPSYNVTDEVGKFQLAGDLRGQVRSLSQWRSNFANGSFFQRFDDIVVAADGSFSVNIAVDDLISLSTTAGQRNGAADLSPPVASVFPSLHEDNFNRYDIGQEADLFAQMSGGFEVSLAADGKNKVLRQTSVGFPVKWLRDDVRPFTQVGDFAWTDANVSSRVLVEQSGQAAFIGARAQLQGTKGNGIFCGIVAGNATHLGQWFVAGSIDDVGVDATWLARGYGAIATGEWYDLRIEANGNSAKFYLDGEVVAALAAPSASGAAAIGTRDYAPAQFDDFVVSARGGAPAPTPGPPPLPTPPQPQGCSSVTAGQAVHVFGCGDDLTRRTWILAANGTIQLGKSGLCLGLVPGSCYGGQCAKLGPCDIAPSFVVESAGGTYGQVTTKLNGDTVCLDWDATGGLDKPEIHAIDVSKCNNNFRSGQNQKWAYDQATGALSSALFSSEASCLAVCDSAGSFKSLLV